MSVVQKQLEVSDIQHSVRRARRAAHVLAALSGERRNEALLAAATAIETRSAEILAANEKDCAAALPAVEGGEMSRTMFARLRTTERGIVEMAERVRDVARLPDPLHPVSLPRNSTIISFCTKESCPLGVVGVIFEARPEVVPQVASLALKSGNAVCLKGARRRRRATRCGFALARSARAVRRYPSDSVVLLRSREDVALILTMHGEIDMIVPRGSEQFVATLPKTSRIPVLVTGRDLPRVHPSGRGFAESVRCRARFEGAIPGRLQLRGNFAGAPDIAAAFLPQMIAQFRGGGSRGTRRLENLDLPVAREFSPRAKRIGRRNTPT